MLGLGFGDPQTCFHLFWGLPTLAVTFTLRVFLYKSQKCHGFRGSQFLRPGVTSLCSCLRQWAAGTQLGCSRLRPQLFSQFSRPPHQGGFFSALAPGQGICGCGMAVPQHRSSFEADQCLKWLGHASPPYHSEQRVGWALDANPGHLSESLVAYCLLYLLEHF